MNNESKEVNDIFKEANLDDKIWLFFVRNSNFLLKFCVLLGITVLFWAALHVTHLRKIKKAEDAYSQLQTISDKENFIKKYKNLKLAGIVSLSLADEYLIERKYEAAKVEYARASKLLKRTILQPRALTGKAVAMYQMSDKLHAKELLQSVFRNKNCKASFRRYAAYILLHIASDEGDAEEKNVIEEELRQLNSQVTEKYSN